MHTFNTIHLQYILLWFALFNCLLHLKLRHMQDIHTRHKFCDQNGKVHRILHNRCIVLFRLCSCPDKALCSATYTIHSTFPMRGGKVLSGNGIKVKFFFQVYKKFNHKSIFEFRSWAITVNGQLLLQITPFTS